MRKCTDVWVVKNSLSAKKMLSIVIPTFQEEKFLGRLLKSIRNQTLQPKEIIIADNHSKDRTRIIARKYNCLIVDGGNPAKGRNEGAKMAKGDLILFLDADTVLERKNILEKLTNSFQKRNLDIATPFVIFENPSIKNLIANIGLNSGKIANELLLRHLNKISTESGACILVKKELFNAIGCFDEKLESCEDFEIFKKVSEHGARYGLIGVNISTSDRRYKNMKTSYFIRINAMVVYTFLLGFLGIKDYNKSLKKLKDLYGPLGGKK